jgi:hypothetical protein
LFSSDGFQCQSAVALIWFQFYFVKHFIGCSTNGSSFHISYS